MARKLFLESLGYQVFIEEENKIQVHGQKYNICIAGRPDIVAIKDGWTIVEDIKTGKNRNYHQYQVMLYMLLLTKDSKTKKYCNQKIPHGRLVYNDCTLEIPHFQINQAFASEFYQALDLITNKKTPKSSPSL